MCTIAQKSPSSKRRIKQAVHGILHIKAFQAQWIIQYLSPRDAPWKDILDHWIGDRFKLGRGIILARPGTDFEALLPKRATYMRACFRAFSQVHLIQDTTHLRYESQGEPLWHNPRFSHPFSHEATHEWSKRLNTYRLSDLAGPDETPFSKAQWAHWIRRIGSRLSQEWTSTRLAEIDALLVSIPQLLMSTTINRPPTAVGDYLLILHSDGTHQYAQQTHNGLEEVELDISRLPHKTGRVISLGRDDKTTPLTLWRHRNRHYSKPFAGEDEDENSPEEIVTAVNKPASSAFPLNEGWHLHDEPARKKGPDEHGDDLRRLSDLTIHSLTKYFTRQLEIDGVKYTDARPNCEAAWNSRLPGPPIPWRTIWLSIGTPLSDPTEEKAWRKYLQRAINAKNRHPADPDHTCRFKCGCKDESMQHLLECPHVKPLWRACLNFCSSVLGAPDGINTTRAVLLGIGNGNPPTLLNEASRAFLRHAIGAYYAAATKVHVDNVIFCWQRTFHNALTSFRSAMLRHCRGIRLHYIRRRYTDLIGVIPETDRARFSRLVDIQNNGTYSLTSAFTNAVAAAKKAADAQNA